MSLLIVVLARPAMIMGLANGFEGERTEIGCWRCAVQACHPPYGLADVRLLAGWALSFLT